MRRPGTLLVIVAVALVATLFSAGVLLAFHEYERQRAATVREAAGNAAVVGARFDQFFRERFENLTTIAMAPIVRDGSPVEIKAWFERLVEAGSSFSGGLSLIGTDGIMILLSGFPLGEPPVDLSDRDYVQSVLATDDAALGNAIIGRRSGDPLLTFAVPVRDEGGTMTAILAGTIRLDLPEGGLARLGDSRDDAVIIDGAGQVVVDRGVVSRPVRADPAFIAAVSAGVGATEGAPEPDGSGSLIAGYASVGDSAWRAAVLVDPAEALSAPRTTLAVEVAALGMLAVLGLIAAGWAGRRLDRAAATEQRETGRLRAREDFLQRFADALPVVAGTLDERMRTTFANEALRAKGRSDLIEVVHAEDVGLLPGAAPTGTGPATVDIRLRDASAPGGFRWHRASFLPASNVAGVRWFFAAADVDDEKRAELGLKRDVRQRDEFLALVSHELRTPMSVIVGNVVTLERKFGDDLPGGARDALREIEHGTWQLQRLLENMLVLAQARGPEAESEIEPQVVRRLIERTVGDLEDRFPDARVSLTLDRDLPIVAANETFVDQILWNLLTNAIKYGDSERPIEVSARAVGSFVEVAVADAGPGIPVDELELVFEPHFRSRTGRARAQGLGLGLSVCQRLVEVQGGTITAQQRDGGGTRFVFTLPVIEAETPMEPSAVRTVATSAEGSSFPDAPAPAL